MCYQLSHLFPEPRPLQDYENALGNNLHLGSPCSDSLFEEGGGGATSPEETVLGPMVFDNYHPVSKPPFLGKVVEKVGNLRQP